MECLFIFVLAGWVNTCKIDVLIPDASGGCTMVISGQGRLFPLSCEEIAQITGIALLDPIPEGEDA